jgi:membrane associated rhomboid family serine protease
MMFLGYNLIGVWYQLGGWSSVSSLAHLGGAGAGIVFWMAWRTELRSAQQVARIAARHAAVNG